MWWKEIEEGERKARERPSCAPSVGSQGTAMLCQQQQPPWWPMLLTASLQSLCVAFSALITGGYAAQ